MHCESCASTYEVTEDDLKFYDEISPSFAGKKFPIPAPTYCPTCRLQHRMLFRNERKMYHSASAISGKTILTTFAPDSPYKTCTQAEWMSDSWDAADHGKDFDPTRPLYDQLKELSLAVPHQGLNNINVENSDYTNYGLNLKNCYLLFGATFNEDCLHGKFVRTCKNAIDCLSVYQCDWCYEGIASEQCYSCMYFFNCKNCSDCLYTEDCTSCKNCMMCFGLRNKEYCILNEQLTKAEFERRKKEFFPLTRAKIEKMQNDLDALKKDLPRIASHIYASENCTGEMISNSKDCHNCYDINNCERCKHTSFTPNGVGSYDCTFTAPDGVQWCNHVIATLGHRLMGAYMVWYSHDLYYCINCRNCDYCFGCVGLQNKKYHILNKEYSPEEYEKKVAEIAQQMVESKDWGQFFPESLSQFSYNETIAQEFFPLTKEEVLQKGWRWKQEEDAPLNVERSIDAKRLPDTIDSIPDDVLNWAIICQVTKRPFVITKQELDFYRTLKIPVPHSHPDERHRLRMAKKDAYRLWERTCEKCSKPIQTPCRPEEQRNLYCEECYLKEVY